MYRIHQLKLPITEAENNLTIAAAKYLGVSPEKIKSCSIFKRSIDARDKTKLFYVYALDVEIDGKPGKSLKPNELSKITPFRYKMPEIGRESLKSRPVVVGFGPAGMFCAYLLAKAGFKPIVLERGQAVDERVKAVNDFFETGKLNINSNVCFGEGGAGTFSDGKLNTLIKDKDGKGRHVLETFVKHGANPEILYDAKPHIGTDKLIEIVKNLRNEIIALGGEVRFNSCAKDFLFSENKLSTVITESDTIDTELCILATGHSARDTFETLYNKSIHMEPKPFAMGVRVMHKQKMIDENQYGAYADKLPAASYKLTHTCDNGRGVYSFCMCPGGYVVNASSETGCTVINGMSYSDRAGENANAAIICNVTPEDFKAEGFGEHPLSGVEFQRKYEKMAYEKGSGKIIIQQLGDYNNNKPSECCGSIKPEVKGEYVYGNVRECLPEYVADSISEAMSAFDRKIKGFGNNETLMLGIETRTSSPVRIVRDESLNCSGFDGLYPCGEGAGYAGGIMSATLDGIKVAEKIISTYTNEGL